MSEHRVALITGANKGIGLQIAKDLASHGLTVLIGSRKYENGEAAAKTIGEKAHAIQLDVTDQSSIAAAAERIRREFGRLDVLVNNAGIVGDFPEGTTFEERLKFNTPSQSPLSYILAKPNRRKSQFRFIRFCSKLFSGGYFIGLSE
jgi:NAD(P)-dependent dehydrogenase (short-subunit alcohol dehydrogenase family)